MGYTKTEFQPKDTLPAKVINEMQDTIIENEKMIAKLTPVLLWENASPSSTFPSQTIPLNLSEYGRFEFKMFLGTSNDELRVGICSLGEKLRMYSDDYYYATFKPTANGVEFVNAKTDSSGTCNVPYQIVGYKY